MIPIGTISLYLLPHFADTPISTVNYYSEKEAIEYEQMWRESMAGKDIQIIKTPRAVKKAA